MRVRRGEQCHAFEQQCEVGNGGGIERSGVRSAIPSSQQAPQLGISHVAAAHCGSHSSQEATLVSLPPCRDTRKSSVHVLRGRAGRTARRGPQRTHAVPHAGPCNVVDTQHPTSEREERPADGQHALHVSKERVISTVDWNEGLRNGGRSCRCDCGGRSSSLSGNEGCVPDAGRLEGSETARLGSRI